MHSKSTITANSAQYLQAIKALWRKNSATLGFFPDGAFQEYAAKKQILVCHDHDQNLLGYLLYRISDQKLMIVHLCIDSAYRGYGLAKKLVDWLIKTNGHYYGLGLKCRRDFDANKLWPAMGFAPYYDAIGKSKDRKELTFWWMDFGHASLFSATLSNSLKEKLCVAIDANIFFGLNDSHDIEDEEAKALLADWLPDTLEFFLTQEIFNEIDREPNPNKRNHQKAIAQNYSILPLKYDEFHVVREYLKGLLPEPRSDSAESDIRQLAHAISSELKFFITRDQELINLHDIIYEKYGVSILRPSDFIVHIDELQKEEEYQPYRLTGTQFKFRLIQQGESDDLAIHFQNSSQGENKASFNKLLRKHLADPVNSRCYLFYSADGSPLALVAYCRNKDYELEIPLFRVKKGSLSSSVARHLIISAKLISAKEKRKITAFTDEFLSEGTTSALEKESFSRNKAGWRKLNLLQIGKSGEIAAKLKSYCHLFGENYEFCVEMAATIEQIDDQTRGIKLLQIERHLWPLKFLDAHVPCFIIPIQPVWALQLFDAELGNQDLLGASELVFNRELVYYRSKRNSGGLTAPGRILWYVSGDSDYQGTGQIRACSYIDEIDIGTPKELYKKYRRLGVYQWRDVLKTAKNELSGQIMAIRFSDTHLLTNPLDWKLFQKMLLQHSVKTNLQSPAKIDYILFNELYIESFNTSGGINYAE